MYKLILALLAVTSAGAYAVTQTDWSGGNGVPGPVTDWGNSFNVSSGVDWSYYPDSLLLTADVIQENTVDDNYTGSCCVHSDDVDGDGDMDILGTARMGNAITWWENLDGSGTSWLEHTINGNYGQASSVYTADMDSDGDIDVLGAASSGDEITWWENINGTGTTWTEHTVGGNFDGAISVQAADIDGDSDMDVLGAGFDANDITWWENTDGSGVFWNEHTINSNYNHASSVCACDIDDDGFMDVVGTSYGNNVITWWRNADSLGTSWTEYTVDSTFVGVWDVYSQDINNDGKMDIIGIAWLANDIAWWENMDGSGTSWAKHAIKDNFNGAISVYAQDMDNDGDWDILGAAVTDEDITWWENMGGTGTSWTEHTVDGNYYWAASVYASDINNDGFMDVLGASYEGDKVTWWDIHRFNASGSLESSIMEIDWSSGDSISWGAVTWLCDEPDSTGLAFLVRSSDNAADMGDWSDTITVSGTSLNGILEPRDNYLQYMAVLKTDNNEVSPALFEITIDWNIVGVAGETQSEVNSIQLLPISPNPVTGAAVITFELPETASVGISVFDMSGRLIREIHRDDYAGGTHGIMLGELPPGSYLCRMTSDDFEDSQRFVVLK